MLKNYVFIGWENGAYITSQYSEFSTDFDKLVEQYGQPNVVEIRQLNQAHYQILSSFKKQNYHPNLNEFN